MFVELKSTELVFRVANYVEVPVDGCSTRGLYGDRMVYVEPGTVSTVDGFGGQLVGPSGRLGHRKRKISFWPVSDSYVVGRERN
jgi:hypothetical protein